MSQPRPITHFQVWHIAGPMIVANLSTPLLGMVDTAVVGHLSSPHYLGAVAVGSMIFTFVFWGFGFLRMATTGLTAQAYGTENKSNMQAILVQSFSLALLISVGLLALQWPIRELALMLVDSSDAVEHFTADYFDIRIWGAPATLLNYAIIGWLIGIEATRRALLLVLILNMTNIIFDVVFVYLLGMAVSGVALASVIAEYTALIAGLLLLKKQGFGLHSFHTTGGWKRFIAGASGLQVHGNVMIRTFVLILCFGFFTTQSARQGDIVLAANSVLLNFITFIAFVLDGFANATEVLTGKAVGQRNLKTLKRALKLTGLWSIITAMTFSVIYALFGTAIIRLLTSLENVIEMAEQFLLWVIIAPLIGVGSYLLDGLFVGATRSEEMRNSMLFSAALIFFPAWYVLQPWGNHGLWAALMLFLLSRCLSQSLYLPKIFRAVSG